MHRSFPQSWSVGPVGIAMGIAYHQTSPEMHVMAVAVAAVEGQRHREKEWIVSSLAAIESLVLQPHWTDGLEERPPFQRSPIQGASLQVLSALEELALPLAVVSTVLRSQSSLLELGQHHPQTSLAAV